MNQSVVLIIDMLNDFFREGTLKAQREELSRSINNLVRLARANQVPIIWVRQEFASDLSDAFPEIRRKGIAVTIAGTEGAELLPELDDRASDYVIIKKRYSAFFRTDLDRLLTDLNARRLIIAGINTHACVRMTAIDAYQRDYNVVLAEECVSSYDREHHEVTLRYMDGKIVQVMKTAEIFA